MADLPTPDFTFDPEAKGACIAGVRPFRTGSYRLDAGTESGKFVVHNYGHGGAGITLSWGCAAKVRDLVQGHIAGAEDKKAVAVLGSGVMGLTAAMLLSEVTITIYAERAATATTSNKAGGQWAVSVIDFSGKNQEMKEILRFSYETFKDSIGKGFGVSERSNFTATESHNLDVVEQLVPGLLPPRVKHTRLPFEGHTKSGFEYKTLLIEPPIFLPKLETELKAKGVTFVTRKFASKSEILGKLARRSSSTARASAPRHCGRIARWSRSRDSSRCCRRKQHSTISTARTDTCSRAPTRWWSAAPSRKASAARCRTRRSAPTWSST